MACFHRKLTNSQRGSSPWFLKEILLTDLLMSGFGANIYSRIIAKSMYTLAINSTRCVVGCGVPIPYPPPPTTPAGRAASQSNGTASTFVRRSSKMCSLGSETVHYFGTCVCIDLERARSASRNQHNHEMRLNGLRGFRKIVER